MVALAVLGARAFGGLGAGEHDGPGREAIAAGSASGARLLAREHVLSSGRLIEIVIESLGSGGRDPGWGA